MLEFWIKAEHSRTEIVIFASDILRAQSLWTLKSVLGRQVLTLKPELQYMTFLLYRSGIQSKACTSYSSRYVGQDACRTTPAN